MSMFFWTIYAFFVRIAQTLRRWRIRQVARFGLFTRVPKEFVSHPEPKSIGSFARGQQMAIGNFQFSGTFLEAPNTSIWDLKVPDHVLKEIHECAWIDDIAAIGTADGRRLLQAWVNDWMRRYGSGKGPGWRPDITGRRLIHLRSSRLLFCGLSPVRRGFWRRHGRFRRPGCLGSSPLWGSSTLVWRSR